MLTKKMDEAVGFIAGFILMWLFVYVLGSLIGGWDINKWSACGQVSFGIISFIANLISGIAIGSWYASDGTEKKSDSV